jgi:hypothetical protein
VQTSTGLIRLSPLSVEAKQNIHLWELERSMQGKHSYDSLSSFAVNAKLEIREKTVDKKTWNLDCNKFLKIVLALQLQGKLITGKNPAVVTVGPVWLGLAREDFEVPLHNLPLLPCNITSIDIANAENLVQKIPNGFQNSRNGFKEVILRRLNMAYTRQNVADQLVDLCVCLEALFLAGAKDELKFRMRINAAFFMESEPSKRREIYEKIGKIYDMRSKIVHGSNKFPDDKDITPLIIDAFEILQAAVRKSLEVLWPNKLEYFDDFYFSA